MTTELARIRKETFRQALAEGVKELPFVAAVLAVLSGTFRTLNEARFQNFLECVGKPLGCDDFDAATKYVEENIEQPWMVEGLERGWRAVLETLDPFARRCAYHMVSDYMAQKKTPDRFHRQLANFFMEVDTQVLELFLRISDLLDEKGADWACLVIGRRRSPDPFMPSPTVSLPRYELQIFRDKVRYDAIAYEVDELREACSIFLRNSLLTPWAGESWEHPHPGAYEIDELIGIIDERKMDRWRDIRRYVAPLAEEIVAAKYEEEDEEGAQE